MFVLWWVAFIIVVAVIPSIVLVYWLVTSDSRISRTKLVIERMEDLVADDLKKTAQCYLERNKQLISETFGRKYYILPMVFLSIVIAAGFFPMFSSAYPLYNLEILDDLILLIPKSIFYGFFGGWLYVLYSVVTHYRSGDIPHGMVLQLAFQILIAGTMGYFVDTISPEVVAPGMAFAVGFLPYRDLTSWLQLKARSRLGVSADDVRGARSPRYGSDSLTEILGLSPQHRERLAEEDILTVENLAYANPLSLFLVTAYEMPHIIDWIDQAYLRTYIDGQVAAKLAPMGIRGAIELSQVKAYIEDLNGQPAEKNKMLKTLAGALGVDERGAEYIIDQMAGDPQVKLLSHMWSEFGGG